MEQIFRHALSAILIVFASVSMACEADVLRLNYRKAPAPKTSSKSMTVVSKSRDVGDRPMSITARLTASTKLEQR